MVWGTLTCAYFREVGRWDNLEKVLIVERKNLSWDALDTRIYKIEAILSRIDVADDSVIYINESIFCLLHTS